MRVDEIIFAPSGLTAAFRNHKQVPDLQVSWFRLYVDFLKSKKVDPETVVFRLPDGSTTRWVEANWEVKP